MKDTLSYHVKKGIGLGVGFFLGITGSALMAVTVSGIVHIFFPGQPISSAQVNENFASLKTAIESIQPRYSTGETLTAKVWTDGKPIYRIVVPLGAMPNNTNINFPHGVNPDVVVSLNLIGLNGGIFYHFPLSSPGGNESIRYWADATNITVNTEGNYNIYTATAIMEYTK